jgi:hypothetical protein
MQEEHHKAYQGTQKHAESPADQTADWAAGDSKRETVAVEIVTRGPGVVDTDMMVGYCEIAEIEDSGNAKAAGLAEVAELDEVADPAEFGFAVLP